MVILIEKKNEQKLISNFKKIFGKPEETIVILCVNDKNNFIIKIKIDIKK